MVEGLASFNPRAMLGGTIQPNLGGDGGRLHLVKSGHRTMSKSLAKLGYCTQSHPVHRA